MVSQTEIIWNEFGEHLHAFIRKRVRDETIADDLLQDVFMKIHARIVTLREGEKLRAWLYQITRNAILDYYRRQKPLEELSEDFIASVAPESEAWIELAQCVQPLLRQLPEPYREAVCLSELQGLTQQEIAQRQGISLSGAKSRVQRGRAKLKEVFQECCALEFDQRGKVTDFNSCQPSCRSCA